MVNNSLHKKAAVGVSGLCSNLACTFLYFPSISTTKGLSFMGALYSYASVVH